uniref:Ectonucleoside triphosphate diphosphohydrolase 1 n=1 Tax=Latimeria chalumnae TaxID=7897 RepID=H3A2T8_LATCH
VDSGTKPKSQNPWHKKGILFLLFLFVGGLIVLVAMGIAQNRPLRENIKYGIVLDAGSSHTSLFVYKWPAEKQNDTGIVQQHHMCKVKGKGISSYFSEVEKAGLSLTICMDEAKSKIPKDRHKETPVYLGATAGMRLLRLESPTASDAVLNAVKKFLQTYPFSFSGARIITGQEEGAYGWITINYLLENFKQLVLLPPALPNLPPSDSEFAINLALGNSSFNNCSSRKVELLLRSTHFTARVQFGAFGVLNFFFFFKKPHSCTKVEVAASVRCLTRCLLPPRGHREYSSFLFLKNSVCVASSSEAFGNSQCKLISSGWYILHVHIGYRKTPTTQKILQRKGTKLSCLLSQAFSAYYFVMNFLNVTNIQDPLTPALIQDTVEKFCKKPWETVKMEFPSIKEKYLSEYCFSGTYILSLLQDGYKFNTENWKNLKFLGKIGDSDAGWTLGYMLNLTNMIPAELPPSRPLSHGGYVALVVIFVLFLIIVLVIGYVCFRRNANKPTETV